MSTTNTYNTIVYNRQRIVLPIIFCHHKTKFRPAIEREIKDALKRDHISAEMIMNRYKMTPSHQPFQKSDETIIQYINGKVRKAINSPKCTEHRQEKIDQLTRIKDHLICYMVSIVHQVNGR